MTNWTDLFLHGDIEVGTRSLPMLLLVLLLSFCLGNMVGWVYIVTHRGLSYSQSFAGSLVALCPIVAFVMTLMAGNIFIAFGLLAIFAMVRFRNVLKDTRDTTFILWSVAQGMAVGTMNFSTALIACLFISAIFAYLCIVSFGSRHPYDVLLSLQISAKEDMAATLKNILHRHSTRTQLVSQGSARDDQQSISYRLRLRNPARSAELLSELDATGGVVHSTIYKHEEESEY